MFALGMPITIGRIEIQSSEHLYQAMRFPHLSDVQLQVLDADAPTTCKAIARQYDSSTRGDWGAAPEWEGAETLEGRNVLGCLLTELRTKFRDDRRLKSAAKPSFPKALLFSKPN